MGLRLFTSFSDELGAALAARRNDSAPASARLVFTAVLLVIAYIAAAIVLVPPGEVPEFNFVDERGAITVLSAIFLAMGSGFALASYLISMRAEHRERVFLLLIAMAVGFLAVDELLEIHERVGDRLDRIETFRALTDQLPVRNWNDVIVILYGVLAVPMAIYFLPTIIRFPRVFEYLCVACIFYVIHTVIDSITEPPTMVSIMVEESAKLFSSTFIAIGLLVGLLGISGRATSFTDLSK